MFEPMNIERFDMELGIIDESVELSVFKGKRERFLVGGELHWCPATNLG